MTFVKVGAQTLKEKQKAKKPLHSGTQNLSTIGSGQELKTAVTFTVNKWEALPPPSFTCMHDAGQFTITSGYQKLNVVDVPQRVGAAVFAGFDPVTATVPLLFDNYGESESLAVEASVSMLEWMAGIGNPVGGTPAASVGGTLPYGVSITATDTNGQPSRLIPVVYQNLEWVITGLSWGECLRDSNGNRQRQRVTVTVLQHKEGGANTPTEEHGHRNGKQVWKTHKVNGDKDNSCLKLAVNVLHAAPHKTAVEVAKKIKTQNKKLKLQSITSTIKTGTDLKIPTKP